MNIAMAATLCLGRPTSARSGTAATGRAKVPLKKGCSGDPTRSLRVGAFLILGVLAGIGPGGVRAAQPSDIRVTQGEFASAKDARAFEASLAKALGISVKLTHEEVGGAGDHFGVSVEISGDTALVGASLHDTPAGTNVGAAYVFIRSGTAWTQQAKLAASDGAASDQFGGRVALSGDTALVGAVGDDTSAGADAGSAYVFTRSGTVWTQQAKITPIDGASGDFFGVSVALSGDTALVGAHMDDTTGGSNAGSAYVFTRSGSTWAQQAKLTASDGVASDQFGRVVALSGETALVGSPQDDTPAGPNAGSAYVFTRSGTAWSQQAKLAAADSAADDQLGASVALSGDTALVGAPADFTFAGDPGSAYVFTRSGMVWSQQAKLTASDGAAYDMFGRSVALSGDTALVGASLDDTPGGNDAGSAYVFTRSGTAWSQQAKVTAGDGAANDFFGSSVALSGDTAFVGALLDNTPVGIDAGSSYVFTRGVTVWTQRAKLAAGDGAGDQFGFKVALSGDTALVGAAWDDTDAGADAGSAYVFTRSGMVWTQQAKLIAGDGAASDFFGFPVALEGDTALIGARFDDTPAGTDAGSVYVFTRSGATWTSQAKLTAGDAAADDRFGFSLALSGETALVGATWDDTPAGIDTGSVYVFKRSGTTWAQQAQLTAGDGAANDYFGISVALSGDTALIGASWNDTAAGIDAGSVYVFTRSDTSWAQQAQLTAGDGAAGDQFGFSVALSGDTALVGAYLATTPAGLNSGSAYVFTRSGTNWVPQAKLTAADGAAGDQFGTSAALLGDTALVGAQFDDTPAGANAGSAYVFTRSGTAWAQQVHLTAGDAAANDQFGRYVALSPGIVIVGSPGDDSTLSGNSDVGSAYTFVHAYSVTTAASGNGTITPASQSVVHGGAATFTVTPAANHYVDSVTGSNCTPIDQGGSTWTAANITSDCAVTATFALSDGKAPTVVSIAMLDANPTTTSPVQFQITFSEAVTGVDISDLLLVASGTVQGATITGLACVGEECTVTASIVDGDGTLGLNVIDNDTIVDVEGHPLGGAGTSGAGDGSFTGAIYTVDLGEPGPDTPPSVLSILRLDPNPTSGPTVRFAVTFTEAVTGVDASDFVAMPTGELLGSGVLGVTGSGASYILTLGVGAGVGMLRADLVDDDSIVDAFGNRLGGAGLGNASFTAGEAYDVDTLHPIPIFRHGFEDATLDADQAGSTSVDADEGVGG